MELLKGELNRKDHFMSKGTIDFYRTNLTVSGYTLSEDQHLLNDIENALKTVIPDVSVRFVRRSSEYVYGKRLQKTVFCVEPRDSFMSIWANPFDKEAMRLMHSIHAVLKDAGYRIK